LQVQQETVFDSDLSFLFQPENLLLDASGTLKVSDFGLSALSQQVRVSNLAFPDYKVDTNNISMK